MSRVRIPYLLPKLVSSPTLGIKEFIMELEDTIEGMLSSDYSESLRAEYDQASIRLEKLTKFLNKYGENIV